jgi:hypothetical protein
LEFLNKSANKSTEGGLPGRRGVTRDTPVRNAANPMSLNDLSSPTPTESDLDYAGYDMGGQDQTDQQEGVIGKRVRVTAPATEHAYVCA